MTKSFPLSYFASAVVLSAATFATPAQALPRAWVSGHGTDKAGCGALADPCRTLQYVHDHIIDAGGEIDILDPAGYGPLTIVKSLTVANDGAGVSDLQAAGNADVVTINAGEGDEINLRGLTITGGPVSKSGVRFNSGAALTIRDSSIRGFKSAGVYFAPSAPASFTLAGVTVSRNTQGVYVQPTGAGAVNGVIDRSSLDANANYGVVASGGSGAATVSVTVVDSSASQNTNGVGVFSSGARTVLLARNVAASDNGAAGFQVGGHATLRLTRSLAAGNSTGVAIAGGSAVSFGDNNLEGNGVAVSGGSMTKLSPR